MIRPLKSRHILTIKWLILMYDRSKVLQRLLINTSYQLWKKSIVVFEKLLIHVLLLLKSRNFVTVVL